MKFYYSPGSCSLASHIVLEEIGKSYEAVLVSSKDGSTHSADYLKINPKGQVPVLSIGESVMTENLAIMTYLALSNPGSELLPNSPEAIAKAIEWISWLSGLQASGIRGYWRTERFSDDANAYPGIKKKALESLSTAFTLVDFKLKDSQWAVNDKYSIADPYLLVYFRWGNLLGLDMQNLSNWTAHAKKIEQREAVQRVLTTENISIWE